jgi:hypothetical protein
MSTTETNPYPPIRGPDDLGVKSTNMPRLFSFFGAIERQYRMLVKPEASCRITFSDGQYSPESFYHNLSVWPVRPRSTRSKSWERTRRTAPTIHSRLTCRVQLGKVDASKYPKAVCDNASLHHESIFLMAIHRGYTRS